MNHTTVHVSASDLLAAISAATEGGRVGIPCNVRIHWQVIDNNLTDAAIVAAKIADSALSLDGPTWRVRSCQSDGCRLLHVLGEDKQGRTALVSLCTGDSSEFSLTVFGNLGTLRLENSGLDESSPLPRDDEPWMQSLHEAIADGQ